MTIESLDKISYLRKVFESEKFYPKKKFGQNFLIDKNFIRFIIESANLSEKDLVIEIGPGAGVLTRAILEKKCQLISVEIDHDLARICKDHMGEIENWTLLETDVMEKKSQLSIEMIEKIKEINPEVIKCCANLPYSISTSLLICLMGSLQNLEEICVLVQDEIAEKICCQEKSKEYGILSVVANAWGKTKYVKQVPHSAFWPQPKVTSAIVHIKRGDHPILNDFKSFAQFVKESFQHRRKRLLSTLKKKDKLSPLNEIFERLIISHEARPEDLSPTKWIDLYQELKLNSSH